MSESLFLHLLFYYYAIGFVVAILFDHSIRSLETSEPFTLYEFIMTVLLWPAAVYTFISKFFS